MACSKVRELAYAAIQPVLSEVRALAAKCDPICVEKRLHALVRREDGHSMTLAAVLTLMVGCEVCMPLFVTGELSFGAAEEECYERIYAVLAERHARDEDWDFDAKATRRLFPVHLYNSMSTVVSLLGFLSWLFFSPHASKGAPGGTCDLDRKLGSYHALRLLANMLMTASSLWNCSSSPIVDTVLSLAARFVFFGLSIIGTNLMSHRYLSQKASVMVKILNDDRDSSAGLVKKLEASFVWEVRMLYLVAVGVILYFASPTAAFAVGALGALLVIATDTIFSILLTRIFLRPIIKVLGDMRGVRCRSAGHLAMQQTKWLTLVGSTLIVASSTGLYVNAVLFMLLSSRFMRSSWLNIFVYGGNMDSIVNDVGMLFVCGLFKRAWNSQPPLKFRLRRSFKQKLQCKVVPHFSYHSKSSPVEVESGPSDEASNSESVEGQTIKILDAERNARAGVETRVNGTGIRGGEVGDDSSRSEDGGEAPARDLVALRWSAGPVAVTVQ